MSGCKHSALCFTPSQHGNEVGYWQRFTDSIGLASAATPAGHGVSKNFVTQKANEITMKTSTFPAPLVLPGDELSWDPEYEEQRLRPWMDANYRNRVTDQRRTLYVVSSPTIDSSVDHVHDWAVPGVDSKGKATGSRTRKAAADIPKPKAEDIREYLESFYHPLPIEVLQIPELRFVPWVDKSRVKTKRSSKKTLPSYIGLNIGSEVIGIRHRPSKDGLFSGQLNLNNLLDAAIAILPPDAYALVMLVDHDLYEGEEDDFCCGRAYGGSRVSVVSTARYNPVLDELQGVETEHAWPASHCRKYVEDFSRGIKQPAKKKRKATASELVARADEAKSAMGAALRAFAEHTSGLTKTPSSTHLATLWFSRVAKTVSHELGHCFGMDHCVYSACIMQGTAGLSEDARQPPYLCPVDLAKVVYATGADVKERYEKLLGLCEKWAAVEGGQMWAAWAAWLKIRVGEVE